MGNALLFMRWNSINGGDWEADVRVFSVVVDWISRDSKGCGECFCGGKSI